MILSRIIYRIRRFISNCLYKRKIGNIGKHSTIINPLHLSGKGIKIGNHTTIQYKSWLEAKPLTGESYSELIIGDGCAIGHFNEIYATKSIIIEDYVLTADRVYISDNLHEYKDHDLPIINQPIRQINPVRIGEGSWLGVGVSVIGASIGKHCVVGANAVVTHDIPDYSVAVGIPAKVIKRYNFDSQKWESI